LPADFTNDCIGKPDDEEKHCVTQEEAVTRLAQTINRVYLDTFVGKGQPEHTAQPGQQ